MPLLCQLAERLSNQKRSLSLTAFIEERIATEVKQVVEKFLQCDGQAFLPNEFLEDAIGDIGGRIQSTSKLLDDLRSLVSEMKVLEAVEKTPNEHWRTLIQKLDHIWQSTHQKRETSKRFKWDTDITQAENVLVQNYHSRLRRNLEDNNLAEAEMISQQMWTHVERLRETQVHADDEEARPAECTKCRSCGEGGTGN